MERTATVTGLPIDGLPIYVRLCSRISGVLQKKDYVYTAATMTAAAAELTSPTPGGTLTSSLVTFTWSAGTAVAEYKLSIGTVLGGATLYNASLGTSTSATVANLPTTGQTLYVRLWSRVGATWLKKDYTFKAAQTTLHRDGRTHQSAGRLGPQFDERIVRLDQRRRRRRVLAQHRHDAEREGSV